MEKRILHIDMDAFFASVEQARDPGLAGLALIVGGDRDAARGVVCAASYEARKYGVHAAMPLAQARRLCPHAVFMRGDHRRYQEVSEQVWRILDTVSPLVERASIDEAYVDVTGSQRLFGGDDAIAARLKKQIRDELRLPCTIAISSNKLVSKVAVGEAKPDGYRRVAPGEEEAFLRPLALRKLPGVGPRTAATLESMGLFTAGQLVDYPMAKILDLLGPGGYALQRAARGVSTSELVVDPVPKSFSRETTFERDILDWELVERMLSYLAERAAYAMRCRGMETRCVTVKVRYADFETRTFGSSLPEPTAVDGEILKAVRDLTPKIRERRARIRLVGVALSSLSDSQHQMKLLDGEQSDKLERLTDGVDHVRSRFGFEAIRLGSSAGLGVKPRLSTPSLSR